MNGGKDAMGRPYTLALHTSYGKGDERDARITELEARLADVTRARDSLLVRQSAWWNNNEALIRQMHSLRSSLLEVMEALRNLHEHTKRNYQICGLNVSAEAALGKATAMLDGSRSDSISAGNFDSPCEIEDDAPAKEDSNG